MAFSYNGWLASKYPQDFGGLDNRIVPGTQSVRLAPGVRAGDVAVVLFYVATQLHERVESGQLYVAGDDWGFNFRLNRNANNLSCHSSGTAFDWNATRHPNGKRGTFTVAQVREIRKILAEVNNVVGWGGDFTGTPDEMHFEIQRDSVAVAQVAARIRGDLVVKPQPTSSQGLFMYLTAAEEREILAGIRSLKPGIVLPARSSNARVQKDDYIGSGLNAQAEAADARAALEALVKRLEAKGII